MCSVLFILPSCDKPEPEMPTPETEVMAAGGGGWFQRVQALEQQVTDLTAKVLEGEEYMQTVNTTLKKYVFYIYGTASDDPAENLAQLEKWVLDVRAEMKQLKDRLASWDDLEEEVLLLTQRVEALEGGQ
jgi:hypothetical protein